LNLVTTPLGYATEIINEITKNLPKVFVTSPNGTLLPQLRYLRYDSQCNKNAKFAKGIEQTQTSPHELDSKQQAK